MAILMRATLQRRGRVVFHLSLLSVCLTLLWIFLQLAKETANLNLVKFPKRVRLVILILLIYPLTFTRDL